MERFKLIITNISITDRMKIFVSPETYKTAPQYEIPMAQAGICEVDKTLKLGQILVEHDDGAKYLIEMSATDTVVTKVENEEVRE